MADWWDQPPSHVGVALGSMANGRLQPLEAGAESVPALRAQAAEAREAMALPLEGLDQPTTDALRANAEKIALNYELLAGRLGLPALPVPERAGSLEAMRAALDRLEALGADNGYVGAWREWVVAAGRA